MFVQSFVARRVGGKKPNLRIIEGLVKTQKKLKEDKITTTAINHNVSGGI